MWQTLKRHYDNASTRNSRNAILNQFHAAKMEPTYSVASDYIAYLRMFQSQLAGSESAIDDYMLLDHLLKTLPDRYSMIACVLRQLPEDKFSIHHIESALQAEESSQQSRSSMIGIYPNYTATQAYATALSANMPAPSTETQLGTSSTSTPSQCPNTRTSTSNGRIRKINRYSPSYRTSIGQASRNLEHPSREELANSEDRCWYCNRRGHKRVDCRTRATAEHRQRARQEATITSEASISTTHYPPVSVRHPTAAAAYVDALLDDVSNLPSEVTFAPATSFSVISVADSDILSTHWIIDSGASYHITYDRRYFSTYQLLSRSIPVRIANGVSYPAIAMGIVMIDLQCGATIALRNVLHVPAFHVSLVSVHALNQTGLHVSFNAQNATCQIKHMNANASDTWTTLGYRPSGLRTCFLRGHVQALSSYAHAMNTRNPHVSPHLLPISDCNNHAATDMNALSATNMIASPQQLGQIPTSASKQPPLVSLSLWHKRFGHLNYAHCGYSRNTSNHLLYYGYTRTSNL